MLIDQAIINVIAGKGGDGIVSFRREAYITKGGPNGGDGGDGGSVYLLAKQGVDTLLDMTGRHHWKAKNGVPGGSKSCHGANGQSLTINVPPGTLIYDDQINELLIDLNEPGMQICISRGGKGGYGNEHFKGATNQTPRNCTPGEPGEEKTIRLELKLIADIGFIGKPNAGKSTLLSRFSDATPKVADYPFTTLEPQLGIAELSGHRRIVLADIPGLIEGAHEGAGLGHAFLRHIERTRILVHVLELEPTDGSNPIENYHAINNELSSYSEILADKKQLVAINKIDLLGNEEDWQTARQMMQEELGCPVFVISAATGVGCRALLDACWHQLHPPE